MNVTNMTITNMTLTNLAITNMIITYMTITNKAITINDIVNVVILASSSIILQFFPFSFNFIDHFILLDYFFLKFRDLSRGFFIVFLHFIHGFLQFYCQAQLS